MKPQNIIDEAKEKHKCRKEARTSSENLVSAHAYVSAKWGHLEVILYEKNPQRKTQGTYEKIPYFPAQPN